MPRPRVSQSGPLRGHRGPAACYPWGPVAARLGESQVLRISGFQISRLPLAQHAHFGPRRNAAERRRHWPGIWKPGNLEICRAPLHPLPGDVTRQGSIQRKHRANGPTAQIDSPRKLQDGSNCVITSDLGSSHSVSIAAMRRCLLEPVPELTIATKMIDAAADAILAGDMNLAGLLIRESNHSSISDYVRRTVGKLSDEVHGQTTLPKVLPRSVREATRMPTAEVQRQVFARDGWHCRFCGIRVLYRPARARLIELFPVETNWVDAEYERHAALYACGASLDHVLPHSRGGGNEVGNLVTACFCCQFGRGQFTLDEVQLTDPRDRGPIVTSWDGLTRLQGRSANRTAMESR